MKITPLEIRQKTFEKTFRGLDKDEVNAFLQSLSHEWERMIDENKGIKTRLEKAEKEVAKLKEFESTLFKTLKTAEDTSANVVEQANKTAELHMKEIQIKSEALLNDAKINAKTIIEKADNKAMEIVSEMQKEIKILEENYRIIENHKDNIISQLKLTFNDVMEKVNKFNNKEENMRIESHMKKVRELVRETSKNTVEELSIDFNKIKTEPVVNKTNKSIPTQETSSDEAKVKKNYILGNEPIERAPLQNSSKVIEAVNQDDLSFFDQLED